MEKCRQSTKLHLGLLVRGWIFSQQLKLCYQTRTHTHTHTQKRIHFLYGRNHPEFEALLYLRLLQFLPWLTQGLINKKEKEKTGMWAERNYWATFQKKKKTTRMKSEPKYSNTFKNSSHFLFSGLSFCDICSVHSVFTAFGEWKTGVWINYQTGPASRVFCDSFDFTDFSSFSFLVRVCHGENVAERRNLCA